MLERVLELGYLRAEWVAGDDAFGMSPTFREGLAALGMRTCWTFRAALRSGPWTRLGPVRNWGSAAPANPSCGLGSGGPWSSAVMNCRMRLGRWPREARGRAPTGSVPSGCGPPGGASPARNSVWRRNLDGSEPRYYLSNAPEGTTLETLAYVGGSRWRIETEFETEKGEWGWTNTRPAAGQGGITT